MWPEIPLCFDIDQMKEGNQSIFSYMKQHTWTNFFTFYCSGCGDPNLWKWAWIRAPCVNGLSLNEWVCNQCLASSESWQVFSLQELQDGLIWSALVPCHRPRLSSLSQMGFVTGCFTCLCGADGPCHSARMRRRWCSISETPVQKSDAFKELQL